MAHERDNRFKPDIADSAVPIGGLAAECDRKIVVLGQNVVVSLSSSFGGLVFCGPTADLKPLNCWREYLIQSADDLCPQILTADPWQKSLS